MRNGFAKLLGLTLFLALVITPAALTLAQRGPQQNELSEQGRGFNNQLLTVYTRLSNLQAGDTPEGLRAQAASIIGQRAAVLEALAAEKPESALSLAFSPDLLSDLARAFPNAAKDLESTGEWEGPLEVTVEDGLNPISHKTVYRMSAAGGQKLNIHFATGDSDELESGDVLRVRGMRMRSEIAAMDGGTITGTSAPGAAMCSPLGAQKSIVLLVNMPGTAAPSITTDAVRDIFFGTTPGKSVSDFWRENSYGKAWAEGDVKGWYTLDAPYTCDQYPTIRDAAIRAADRDVDFSQYSRVFVVISGMGGNCAWAGVANVGCGSAINTAEGNFTVSTAWMLSGYFSDRDQGVELATHEGGHSLGLSHAATRDFGAEPLGGFAATGTLDEYGDMFSTMGFWNFGHYAAPHKVKLGWMQNYVTVTGNGSFAVQPAEAFGNVQALKVQRGSDTSKFLWVEYRQKSGLYDSLLPSQVYTGGLVHYQDSVTGNKTNLLDFTPETTTFNDPALVGTWTDPYSNLSIAVGTATPEALNVDVSYGTVPCSTSSPTVALSPSNPSALAGTNVNYTVSVTNNDTSSCPSQSFTMSSLVPGTWPTSFGQNVLTVSPGSSMSTTMTKSVPAGTPAATYAVDAVVAGNTGSIEKMANLTVKPPTQPIAMTLSLPTLPLTKNSTATMSALVTQGTAGVPGATVVFTVTSPSDTSTRKVTTDSSGRAVWSFKVTPKTTKGIYTVTAQATYGTETASSGGTFMVQ